MYGVFIALDEYRKNVLVAIEDKLDKRRIEPVCVLVLTISVLLTLSPPALAELRRVFRIGFAGVANVPAPIPLSIFEAFTVDSSIYHRSFIFKKISSIIKDYALRLYDFLRAAAKKVVIFF